MCGYKATKVIIDYYLLKQCLSKSFSLDLFSLDYVFETVTLGSKKK